MIELKPPFRHESALQGPALKVFLAGTIEMGNSHDWQADVKEMLKDVPGLILFNPRRDDWDSSWDQEGPEVIDQIEWELEHMEKSDIILMHFEPGTKSMITLLEFGLYCKSGKLVVHCPRGYERKTNVDVTGKRYGTRFIHHIAEIASILKEIK